MDREKVIIPSESFEQPCRRFSLVELKSATHDFDDALVIGKGGFGTVYKGPIDNGERTVALKRSNGSGQGATEFWAEIEILSRSKHEHLVSLIGYCFEHGEHDEMIIVYEYMNSGTLYDHLFPIDTNQTPLSWVQRLKICIGVAHGLNYFHTGTDISVIHRDVKSANILLNENCVAKIFDFGLAKIINDDSKGPTNQSVARDITNQSLTNSNLETLVAGTLGYMDPEYVSTGKVTSKSDVFSFGVVLLEVLSGKRAIEIGIDEDEIHLASFARRCIDETKLEEITDPNLREPIVSTCLNTFIQIAYKCLDPSSKERPTMATVIVQLQSALTKQESTSPSIGEEKIINTGRTSGIKSATMKFTRKLFSGSEQVQQPMSCYSNRARAPHTQQITRERMGPFLSASGEHTVSMVDAFSRFSIIGRNKRIEVDKKSVNEELLKMQTLTDRNGERVEMKMPNLTDRNRERVGMKIIESGQVDRFLRSNINDKAACVDFLLEELDREAVLPHHFQR